LLGKIREKHDEHLCAIKICKERVAAEKLFEKSNGSWKDFVKLRDDKLIELRSLCGLLSGLGHNGKKLTLGCLISESKAKEEQVIMMKMLDNLIFPPTELCYNNGSQMCAEALSVEKKLHFDEQEISWNQWFSSSKCDFDTSEESGSSIENAEFKICMKCFNCLGTFDKKKPKDVPWQALINNSWQGIIPPELQACSSDNISKLDGLTMIELSMICLYNPITFLKMLPSGK